MEDTPDNLPQCAGFITANPQTALAHVNVIAKTRAIPNVYVSGILDDANLAQLAAARAPVALRAIAATDTEPAHVDLVPMTEQELATYRSLSTVPPLTVEQPDFSAMPYVVDLTVPDLAHQDEWRLVIGGKSMGIAGLLDVAGVGAPDKPLGISVRPYHEHIEAMRAQLVQMMADPAFSQSVLVRLLVLEGTASYDVLFPSPTDQRFKQDFLDAQPAGTVLGDIAAAGGVQQMIKDKPIDPAALQSITNVLETAYGNYSAAEGLRFRSSTQIEDSEVFQGVGIGLSFTGYLRAAQLPDTDPHHAKTVERAIKEVWAAYWRSAGYEERQLANIDQLSANMGVTVHARSDDHDELANGDLFVTLDPPNFDDVFTLELDVQPGATPSVTNPGGSTDLPEHDVMHQARSDGAVTIERVQHATLNPTGFVLDDADLATIFDQMTRTAQYYFDTENEPATDGQRRRTLTLDVEFRKMAANWPETIDGTTFPERIIFRQAASVFPSTARIPASVKALPIPLDVLSHAQRIEQRVCTSPAFRLTTVETYTNPLVQPDLGFAAAPFTSSVDVEVLLDEPSIGASLGDHLRAEHPVFATQGHDGMQTGGPWNLDVTVADVDSAAAGFTRLRYTADGAVHVDNAAGAVDEPGGAATCERTVLYATPEDFLKDIIASTPGGG